MCLSRNPGGRTRAGRIILWRRTGAGSLAFMVVLPIVFLVACSLALAVAAGPAFELVEVAAVQLMEPAGYVEAVLGGGGR